MADEDCGDQLVEIEGAIRDMIASTTKGSITSLRLHREIGDKLIIAKALLPRKYSSWVKSKFPFGMVWASRLTKLASNWNVIEPLIPKWKGETLSVEKACRIIQEKTRNSEGNSAQNSRRSTKLSRAELEREIIRLNEKTIYLEGENMWQKDQREMYQSSYVASERERAALKSGASRAPIWIYDSEWGVMMWSV